MVVMLNPEKCPITIEIIHNAAIWAIVILVDDEIFDILFMTLNDNTARVVTPIDIIIEGVISI